MDKSQESMRGRHGVQPILIKPEEIFEVGKESIGLYQKEEFKKIFQAYNRPKSE